MDLRYTGRPCRDITAREYGSVKVLGYVGKCLHSIERWRCWCGLCQREFDARRDALTSGDQRTCGRPGCRGRGRKAAGWLVAMLASVTPAMAEPVRISLVHDRTIPRAVARAALADAASVIERDTGVRLKLVRSRAMRLPVPRPDYPRSALATYRHLANGRTRALVLVQHAGAFGGQGAICGDVAVAAVVPWAFRYLPYPREYRTATAELVMHELGHMLGALHTSDGTVMDSGRVEARFSERSVAEIEACSRRR